MLNSLLTSDAILKPKHAAKNNHKGFQERQLNEP